MPKFYKKELEDQPVFVAGHPLRFDFLETNDATLIAELDKCVRRNAGGVTEITAEQYSDEVKKKELERLSGNSLKLPPHRQELTAFQLGNPGAAVASRFAARQQGFQQPAPQIQHPMPDPIEVPTAASFALPPTAKMKDLKDMAERAKPK